MKNKLTEKEYIQLIMALDERINEINKRITENSRLDLHNHVQYWQDKLISIKSAANKLKYIDFVA